MSERFFRALADTTRLRCLVLLAREGELCVCELTHALAVPQPRVSRHQPRLAQMGQVADRRAGQWIYYRLHPDLPPWQGRVLAEAVAALADESPFREDAARLAAMADRPGAACCD